MKRWVYFLLCVVFGLALLLGGWLMPIHLRAVNSKIIQRAGENSSGVIDRGLALAIEKNIGAAEMFLEFVQKEKIPGHEKLHATIETSATSNPQSKLLGTVPRLQVLQKFSANSRSTSATNTITPFTALIIQSENRNKALAHLEASPDAIVQLLLRTRALTNTVLFSPSQSSSGQAYDAALCITGLLIEGKHLTRGLSDTIFSNTGSALRGDSTQALEQMFLDFMSLGQRFNWGQLTAFCESIEDAETLRLLANLARKENAQLPALFSAVQLSGNPAGVANYLMTFSETGEKDVAASLHFGAGGLNELLNRNQRLHTSDVEGRLNAVSVAFVYLPWQMPELALGLKWLLYLLAGFLFALALHFARPRVPATERPFQARGFHVAREILFALGFLLIALLLSEPFLAQESQKVEFPIRLQLPMVDNAVPVENPGAHEHFMNQLSLYTLLLFFVLQGLIYIGCLVKLAEIRRQTFAPRIKLKLLENEDNFFDAGLYLGFAGTIISLILVSVGVIKPSLMAAYSSTAFGVIFVSIFKIFHLRPLRRKLLLEAEAAREVSAKSEPALTTPL